MKVRAYPNYKPSGVEWLGKVPEHWEAKRLKYSASINDEALPDTTKPDLDLSYVDISSVDAIRGIVAIEEMTFEQAPSRARRIVRDGDTIVSTVRTYLKAIVPIRAPRKNMIVSTGFAVIRPRRIRPEFMSYAVREAGFVDTIVALSVGVSYPAVNASDIGMIPVPLPPVDEQRVIADFLDRETAKIDTLVAKKRTLIERLKEKRTALISRTVTRGLPPVVARAAGLDPHPRLKPSGIDWLGDMPEHWLVKPLRYVGEAIIGLTFDPSDVADQGDGVLVLRASNVSDGRIILEDNVFVKTVVPQKLITRAGDILICSRSGSRALIGKNARLDERSAGLSFGVFMTVFRSPSNDYLFYLFNSPLFDYQSGAFLTSTINQLTIGNLYSFKVPIPPPDEQTAIATYLARETARIDHMVAKVGTAIERLQEYRTALITAAVTGKIDVRGAIA